ncbi:hypothetical protein AM588_10006042 [Phytophthora nicotianae]|uniref:Ubiquitin-like protease family profile domain-containing protein n=1 Tax=Phytophthora nicotianae TaxID=4792 RepID=A0A0W8DJB6_PHYNI|nr:hypothetical protein AM588_10006042 [Phytophthora nicotianae]
MAAKNKTDELARWDDYGFATYGQLKLMTDVVQAKNNFALVEATMAWVDTVDFHVASIVHPFKDTEDVTKDTHKHTVDNMNLGSWYAGRHVQLGCEFLDFRENLWLHTGSIIGGLLLLRETYESVGIVNPRFHDFDHPDQKTRTAKAYGATASGTKRVISVINLGNHWGAFFVNVETTTCYLFDPLQLKSNLSTLKKAVATVVEPMLGITTSSLMKPLLDACRRTVRRVEYGALLFWSCYCSVQTRKLGDYWSDSMYDVVGYLRMRYLHKVISLERRLSVTFDNVE